MQLQVRPDHLDLVRAILKRHVPDRVVWAFGSRVSGTAKAASDLDLVIDGVQALEFETLACLRDDFSESSLPYRVDVIDWAMVGESFRRIIEASRLPIQPPPPEPAP